jgi:putative inorganic carbon (HCO3(-)) transporter
METKNKYLWIYLTGFFLILILPFLNLPPFFSPPDWGKTIVFRSIMAILLFIFLVQILFKEKISIKTSKTFWLLIALLLVFSLATLFSLDRSFSFWGSPYRSGGFLNFAFYIIFAILAFLILRKSDWEKVWVFSFIIAVLVSLVAIFQRFGILSNIFVSVLNQPWSTIGGSTFLAVYLLILSFLALTFILRSIKNLDRKWFFYLPCLLLFIFVIFITVSRAAYLGILVALIYFFFPYYKKLIKPKVLIGILLFISIILVSYFSLAPSEVLERLSINKALDDPRFSVWRISARAIKGRPVLGYGPENFSIAFDKHYDPTLPRMELKGEETTPTTWYDRAHSFIFDIGVTAGIPALIIYILLFASLLWGLEKIKKNQPDKRLICHGVQTAFIAYLTANFFSFDIFSTYLISFLLIGFSLSLMSNNLSEKKLKIKLNKAKYPIIIILFIGLCWFIWSYNIKPFQINTEINMALSSAKRGQPEKALRRIENILPSDTFINEYLRSNYIEIINIYIIREPQRAIILIPRGIEIVRSALEIRPSYTRYWLMIGRYHNILLKNYQNVYPELVDQWKNEAETAFQEALKLSSKRQEIFLGQAETYFYLNDFEKAKEKVQECIDLNPKTSNCWWRKALINLKMNEVEKAKENIKIAQEKGFPLDYELNLLELKEIYLSINTDEQYLEEICNINYRLKKAKPDNPNYKINVLACYMRLKEYDKIKEIVNDVARYYKNYGEKAEEVLLAIRQNLLALDNYQDYYQNICQVNVGLVKIDETNLKYRLDLLDCFIKIGDTKTAQELAVVIIIKWPEYTDQVNKMMIEAGL